jgi:hypothetical protein
MYANWSIPCPGEAPRSVSDLAEERLEVRHLRGATGVERHVLVHLVRHDVQYAG